MDDILYIVMPVYNEEEIIKDTISIVTKKIKKLITGGRGPASCSQ